MSLRLIIKEIFSQEKSSSQENLLLESCDHEEHRSSDFVKSSIRNSSALKSKFNLVRVLVLFVLFAVSSAVLMGLISTTKRTIWLEDIDSTNETETSKSSTIMLNNSNNNNISTLKM